MSTPREPSIEDLNSAPVLPGFEMPEEVVLKRSTIHSPALQPEDLGVLAWLKTRDPRRPAKQDDLAREMQAHGWKMGKSRFASVFQRLKAAGHIKHHCPYNPETGRPEWRIEFFMNPANNDEYVTAGISAFPQVGAETPVSGDSQTEQLFETPETRVSQGQKGSRVSRDSAPDPRFPGIPSGRVSAGQDRNPENRVFGSAPPHPLGGGGTTPPPNPLTSSSGTLPQQSQGEEEVVFEQKDLEAATAYLQQLPDPWVVGERDARETAPELLAVMHRKGWPKFTEVDLKSLTPCLATNPGGANSLPSVLRYKRIPNLPAYSRVAARAAARSNTPAEGMCTRHPGFREDDCSPCRKAEMERGQRKASDLAPVDGAGLLASLLKKTAD